MFPSCSKNKKDSIYFKVNIITQITCIRTLLGWIMSKISSKKTPSGLEKNPCIIHAYKISFITCNIICTNVIFFCNWSSINSYSDSNNFFSCLTFAFKHKEAFVALYSAKKSRAFSTYWGISRFSWKLVVLFQRECRCILWRQTLIFITMRGFVLRCNLKLTWALQVP